MHNDYTLALCLLNGFGDEDEQGRVSHRYLKEEREARQAIARLLRDTGPLDRGIRNALAGLFDPASDCARTLKFESRGRQRRTDLLRNYAIARAVLEARKAGSNHQNAIADVAEKFGVSARTVGTAWRQEKQVLGPALRHHKRQFDR